MDYAVSVASKGEDGYDGVRDDRRNDSLYLRGEIPIGTLGELRLQAGYAKADYEIEETNPLYPKIPRDTHTVDNFQSLQWRESVGEQGELLATVSHNAFEYNDDGFVSDSLVPGIPLEVQFGIDEDRIIGFTASADKPTHRRVPAAGADRVLTKPISEVGLVEAVDQELAGRIHS